MSQPRSILVISLRFLGDVLLTTPLIRSLKRSHPDTVIDVLVFSGTEGILEGNPDIRQAIGWPEKPQRGQTRALLRSLLRRYDLAVVTQTGDRPHLVAWAAAPQRASLIPAHSSTRWWKKALSQRSLTSDPSKHRVTEVLDLAASMGIAPMPEVIAPTAGWSDSERSAQLGFDTAAEAYAVLHLSPRWRYKQWHAAGWHAVLDWLAGQGLRIVITGGPSTEEQSYVRTVLSGSTHPVTDRCGALRMAETADVLRGAALYVGPDTATTHLAAACGTPTVALFGPTDPRLWGPTPKSGLSAPYAASAAVQARGQVMLVQEPSLPCMPCQQEGCERHRNSYSACLDRMPAERVIQAAQALGSRGAIRQQRS